MLLCQIAEIAVIEQFLRLRFPCVSEQTVHNVNSPKSVCAHDGYRLSPVEAKVVLHELNSVGTIGERTGMQLFLVGLV